MRGAIEIKHKDKDLYKASGILVKEKYSTRLYISALVSYVEADSNERAYEEKKNRERPTQANTTRISSVQVRLTPSPQKEPQEFFTRK